MSYATVAEYRARIASQRPAADDPAIQAVLDEAQSDIEQRTARQFGMVTEARTLPVLQGNVFLPDLVSASAMLYSGSRFGAFATAMVMLDEAAPHRRAWIQHSSGFLRIEGVWGFSAVPEAIKGLEIDLAAAKLVDGPRATGRIAQVNEDASIALQVTPESVIEAWRDRVKYT